MKAKLMSIRSLQQHLSLPATRREFLARSGTGLGCLGLASLVGPTSDTANAASAGMSPMSPRSAQYPAKAKHVIHIFLNGGPSHVDTFDPKPSLTKYNGQNLPTSNLRRNARPARRWRRRSSSLVMAR